jgi:tetratricopeptide (TPR) repeat protein
MLKMIRYVISSVVIILLFSCTSPREKYIAEIKSNLEEVNKSFATNRKDTVSEQKAEESINEFIEKYPQDSLSSKYLFELGMLYQKQRKFDKALNAFDRCYSEYPNSNEAGNAVFLQGFLYANVLNNLDKAKEKYQLYLDKYSGLDPKITSDVRLELDNLGKSPDELLKEIQAKADTSGEKSL